MVHFLLHATMPFDEGWEKYAEMDRAGFMAFRHVLLACRSELGFSDLTHIADEARFPVRVDYVGAGPPGPRWMC